MYEMVNDMSSERKSAIRKKRSWGGTRTGQLIHLRASGTP